MIHYKAFAKLKRIAPLYLGHAFKTEKKGQGIKDLLTC